MLLLLIVLDFYPTSLLFFSRKMFSYLFLLRLLILCSFLFCCFPVCSIICLLAMFVIVDFCCENRYGCSSYDLHFYLLLAIHRMLVWFATYDFFMPFLLCRLGKAIQLGLLLICWNFLSHGLPWSSNLHQKKGNALPTLVISFNTSWYRFDQ